MHRYWDINENTQKIITGKRKEKTNLKPVCYITKWKEGESEGMKKEKQMKTEVKKKTKKKT